MTIRKMQQTNLGLPAGESSNDNVTDWALAKFREKYGQQVTKDDIWYYMYGVMHAKDWREQYKHDLQRELPRIPLADDFCAFVRGGAALMQLHVNYETCLEFDIDCVVDDRLVKDGKFASTGLVPDEPDSLKDAFKIDKLKLIRYKKGDYELRINERCRLLNIPGEVEDYTVSGRSPLKWATEVLCVNTKKLNETGIKDDPNSWHAWSSNSFELIRHLRRLIYLSLKSREIINSLPPSLGGGEVFEVGS